jgi:hypothetical protein
MQNLFNERSPLFTWSFVAVVTLASLTAAGCACDGDDWTADVAEVATIENAPNCDFGGLDQRSKASAALAERADPRLLEVARLEAERDCYKAAEARARAR